jgi:hypothetical protein
MHDLLRTLGEEECGITSTCVDMGTMVGFMNSTGQVLSSHDSKLHHLDLEVQTLLDRVAENNTLL